MIPVGNSHHWLIEQSEIAPEKRAVLADSGNITYGQFAERSFNTARFLLSTGISKNDRVAILYRHSFDFFITVNALWLLGAVPVPLNTRLLPAEAEEQLRKADCEFVLVDEKMAGQFSQFNFSRRIISPSSYKRGDENPEKSDLLNGKGFPLVKFSAADPALILFTSGSTSEPKAVVHTFLSLFESASATDSFDCFSRDDIWLSSLPLYHIGGFMILIRALVSGSSLAFPESLKFEDIVSSIKKHLPTHLSLVPTTLRRILRENTLRNTGIKYLYLGGGPSGEQLALDAAGKGWPVVKVYGSSETCSMVTALYPEEIKLRAASSGKILGQNRIKITGNYDSYYGSGINESPVGEILVSARSLFREYYGDPELTAKKIQNGWFHTGDYGRLDNEGYLFIESRREDMIITGGENVSALEVEYAIKSCPGVSDAYVFPLNDEIWGQAVCAAVVTEHQDEEKLKSFLQTKLAGYKIPKRIFFLDALPRNEMGKLNRTALLKKISPD